MNFPTYEEILEDMLQDHKNLDPSADIAKGSPIFIDCSVMASAVSGFYRGVEYAVRQFFPHSAEVEFLDRAGALRGLVREPTELVETFRLRVIDRLRMPPAGGNQTDYIRWALEVAGVKAAYCYPLGYGLGTVDVVILATGDDETPDEELLAAVKTYIDSVRPVTVKELRVLAPTFQPENVTITITGADADIPQIEADIEAHMNALAPGETLFVSKLSYYCISNGADSANVTTPSGNVVPTGYITIRPGTIDVSA